MTQKINRSLILLSIIFTALSFAVASEIHPGLKNAIDSGDYKMAKNLVEKVGVTDIYCPNSLSVKDAENIYASILKDSPFAMIYGNGGNFMVDFNFEINYAEDKCNGSKLNDSRICNQWKEKRIHKGKNLVSTMFDKWIKEDKGLCLNIESMDNCLWYMADKDYIDVEEEMKIIKKIEKNKLIKFEKMVDKDTVIKEPIPQKECLANLSDFEYKQKMYIGAKQNASGTFEFPFGYCSFNGTRQAINACVKKLNAAVKDAEKDCKKRKVTRNVKKTVKKKELVIPLKYRMDAIKEKMLKANWYEMDDAWWENFNLLSKYINNPKEDEILEDVRQTYSSKGDLNISPLVRACKIYPNIDKKVKKAFGFEVFSCKQLLDKYTLNGQQCEIKNTSWILKVPTTLNGKDSIAALACDAKTGKYRTLDKYEFISQEFCENVESSWMKTYYKVNYNVDYHKKPVWYDSVTIVCDKNEKKFRELNFPEKYIGLCTKELEGKPFFMWETCFDEKWQETKFIDTKNQEFKPGAFVKGEINTNYSYFKDFRDNQIYRAVKIDSQIWMAENLNYVDISLLDDSWCYGDDSDNCKYGGRLYTWSAAMGFEGLFANNGMSCENNIDCALQYPVRGICPEGWHLPDSSEWKTLYRAAGSKPSTIQVKNLWSEATDEYNLSIAPTGNYYDKKFYPSDAFFWSSTKDHELIYRWSVKDNYAGIDFVPGKNLGYSVRCIKD